MRSQPVKSELTTRPTSAVSRARTAFAAPGTPLLELDSDGHARSQFPTHDRIEQIHQPIELSHHDSVSIPTHVRGPSYPSNDGSSSSSVRAPLLGGDGADEVHKRRSERGAGRRNVFTTTGRTRIHPCSLVPAFVVGALVVASGVFDNSVPASASRYFSRGDELSGARPNYTLHESGHLFLNPNSFESVDETSSPVPALGPLHGVRHPILDLIANSTQEWEKKLSRQSQTLEAAVREYRRRHRRNPPKGFDKWFAFAKENNVVLIDEFDQTFTDVLPFQALPTDLLLERADTLRESPDTFTMVITNGQLGIVGAHKDDGRAQDQARLMKRWTEHMDDFNMTMSAHDGPSVFLNWAVKEMHVAAAKAGKVLTREEAENAQENAAYWGFPLACPPDSRLRRATDGLETNSLPRGPSYVQNHLTTMSLCENPEWQYLHGFTAWPGAPPQVLRPLFSYAKTTLHSDMLLPPLEQYWDYEPNDPIWENKLHNRAVWRGSTTGVWFDRGTWWRSSQRVRMYLLSRDKVGSRLVRFARAARDGLSSIVEMRLPTHALVKRYLDFGFAGGPGQCNLHDGSCDAVKEMIEFQPPLTWNEAHNYKYMLDLDGNAWSGRFHRLMASNSLVLKSTIFPEWYASWIQPWVHYVPIKVDYTDLFDVMAFFAGDMDGRNAHDSLAKHIALQGKEFAEKHWRYADMEVYFFRLALEWARCSAQDRASMDYAGPGSTDDVFAEGEQEEGADV